MASWRPFSLAMAIGAGVWLGAEGAARAQNADSFFYSNEAALSGGAVVAVPADEGAAWYNPAGLGSVHRTRLNANGSVFGVRVRPLTNGLTSSVRGLESQVDYGGTDFVATPTTASATFSLLPNLTLSGGVFHTSHDVRAANGSETVTTARGDRLSQRIDTITQQRKMHMGGAYGFDLGRGLRVGSAMFLVYAARDDSLDYLVGIDDAARKEVVSLSASRAYRSWGLQSSYGVQWDVTKRLHLGAIYRFPELRVFASGTSSRGDVAHTSDGTVFEVEREAAKTNRIRWSDPARFFLGIAYDLSPKVRVAVDVDVSLALDEDTWGTPHRTMVRGRAGVLVKAIDALHFGFGTFIDPASERTVPTGLGAIRASYVGGTAGIIFRSHLTANPGPDAPVFNLSAAVRYSVGDGLARAAIVGDVEQRDVLVPILVHDVMPYLGSSVAF